MSSLISRPLDYSLAICCETSLSMKDHKHLSLQCLFLAANFPFPVPKQKAKCQSVRQIFFKRPIVFPSDQGSQYFSWWSSKHSILMTAVLSENISSDGQSERIFKSDFCSEAGRGISFGSLLPQILPQQTHS